MQSNRIKAIIVDDEKPSREALSTYIADFCPEIEIVAECDAIKPAYQSILELQPQLVFLDIEMPNGNGFDLLQLFKTLPFRVIFVTAYSDYAIRAFRFAAADYLLKPVKVDELIEAVKKVQIELDKESTNVKIKVLLDSLSNRDESPRNLIVPDNKGFTVLKMDELIMCEADTYCTHFYLIGNRKVVSTRPMKHFEELFGDTQMFRVHRSFLVNLSRITGYTKQGEILLEDNLKCPLGNSYKQEFLDRLGQ